MSRPPWTRSASFKMSRKGFISPASMARRARSESLSSARLIGARAGRPAHDKPATIARGRDFIARAYPSEAERHMNVSVRLGSAAARYYPRELNEGAAFMLSKMFLHGVAAAAVIAIAAGLYAASALETTPLGDVTSAPTESSTADTGYL